ncbi:MAG: HNH endonuclease [Bacteroidota bacterium]
MSSCYICLTILNKRTSSKEHILSNACGGRLISFKLLCKTCNEKMGAGIDAELAKKIAPLRGKMEAADFELTAVHKSIAKSAIDFFLMKRGERRYIQHLIPFLLNKQEMQAVAPHFPDKSFYNCEPGEISHRIKLVGNPSEGILYCYIGLFNTDGYLVRLNDHYDGPSIDKTYLYNLPQSKELKKEMAINYTRNELFSFFPRIR